jgi:hypothetical protein
MLQTEYAECIDISNTFSSLVAKPKGKRTIRRPRHKRENNIKMDVKEMECENVDYIPLTRDRARWRAHVGKFINV